MALLQVENISKSFGQHRVLSDISFQLDAGQALAVLGSNGAGKTTLLRIINRILLPDTGRVFFDGHALAQPDLERIGYLQEERGLYRNMRAGEQVCYLARLNGLTKSDAAAAARQWFERLGAAAWWSRPVAKLSKGMQQRVQFIASVVHRPQLLILDEPFSGFDADASSVLCSEIQALKGAGTAILLSTHNQQAASDLCDNTLLL